MRFWVRKTKQNIVHPGPPPGEGVESSPSPEEKLPPTLDHLSQDLLHFRLLPCLAGTWMGWVGHPACDRRCFARGFCCCFATLGDEQTEALRPAAGWQQLSAGAGCVGLPPSSTVQQRTTGQISRLCRRRGQSEIQGNLETESCQYPSCQSDTARDGTSVDIARPIKHAMTFVAHSTRSVAVCSSFRTSESPPSCKSFSALS